VNAISKANDHVLGNDVDGVQRNQDQRQDVVERCEAEMMGRWARKRGAPGSLNIEQRKQKCKQGNKHANASLQKILTQAGKGIQSSFNFAKMLTLGIPMHNQEGHQAQSTPSLLHPKASMKDILSRNMVQWIATPEVPNPNPNPDCHS